MVFLFTIYIRLINQEVVTIRSSIMIFPFILLLNQNVAFTLDFTPVVVAEERRTEVEVSRSPVQRKLILPYNTTYDSIIIEKATKHGVDPNLMKAVISVESNFNEKAYNRDSGSTGLFQITPDTFDWYAQKTNFQGDLFAVSDNVEMGAIILSDLSKKFSNLREVLAAYNYGQTVVGRIKKQQDWENQLPAETRNYIKTVTTSLQ